MKNKVLKLIALLVLTTLTAHSGFADEVPLGNFTDLKYFQKDRKMGYLRAFSICEMKYSLLYAEDIYKTAISTCGASIECRKRLDSVFRSRSFIAFAQNSMEEHCLKEERDEEIKREEKEEKADKAEKEKEEKVEKDREEREERGTHFTDVMKVAENSMSSQPSKVNVHVNIT